MLATMTRSRNIVTQKQSSLTQEVVINQQEVVHHFEFWDKLSVTSSAIMAVTFNLLTIVAKKLSTWHFWEEETNMIVMLLISIAHIPTMPEKVLFFFLIFG